MEKGIAEKTDECQHVNLEFEVLPEYEHFIRGLGNRIITNAKIARCQNKDCKEILLIGEECEKWRGEIAGEILEETRVRNLTSGEVEFLKRHIKPK